MYDPFYGEAGVKRIVDVVWYLPHAVISFFRVYFTGFVYFSFCGMCADGVYCCVSMR